MAGSGERVARTPSTIYDLSSMLFHTSEAGTSYDQYIRDTKGDTKEVGDQESSSRYYS
jgi:hypothetical protein